MNAIAKPAAELDRKTYIGGSDIAAILNLDPYDRTPLTVYLDKIGELQGVVDPEKERFLARRKRWEGPIVAMLREEFDGEIVAVNQRKADEDLPFLAAEIDFEWRDPSDGSIQNGEIKTVTPFAFNKQAGWGEAGTDEIPVHYLAQVQHGMGVRKRRRCVVAAMSGLDSMTFYHVTRDDIAIAGMRAAARTFWQDHVMKRVPPAPSTLDDFGRLFAKHRGRPVELDQLAVVRLDELRKVRDEIKALKASEEELQLELARFICDQWGINAPDETEDNAALMYAGSKIATWCSGRGAHLDQKRLAEEYPEIKAALTVPHYFRSFRFPKSTAPKEASK